MKKPLPCIQNQEDSEEEYSIVQAEEVEEELNSKVDLGLTLKIKGDMAILISALHKKQNGIIKGSKIFQNDDIEKRDEPIKNIPSILENFGNSKQNPLTNEMGSSIESVTEVSEIVEFDCQSEEVELETVNNEEENQLDSKEATHQENKLNKYYKYCLDGNWKPEKNHNRKIDVDYEKFFTVQEEEESLQNFKEKEDSQHDQQSVNLDLSLPFEFNSKNESHLEESKILDFEARDEVSKEMTQDENDQDSGIKASSCTDKSNNFNESGETERESKETLTVSDELTQDKEITVESELFSKSSVKNDSGDRRHHNGNIFSNMGQNKSENVSKSNLWRLSSKFNFKNNQETHIRNEKNSEQENFSQDLRQNYPTDQNHQDEKCILESFGQKIKFESGDEIEMQPMNLIRDSPQLFHNEMNNNKKPSNFSKRSEQKKDLSLYKRRNSFERRTHGKISKVGNIKLTFGPRQGTSGKNISSMDFGVHKSEIMGRKYNGNRLKELGFFPNTCKEAGLKKCKTDCNAVRSLYFIIIKSFKGYFGD